MDIVDLTRQAAAQLHVAIRALPLDPLDDDRVAGEEIVGAVERLLDLDREGADDMLAEAGLKMRYETGLGPDECLLEGDALDRSRELIMLSQDLFRAGVTELFPFDRLCIAACVRTLAMAAHLHFMHDRAAVRSVARVRHVLESLRLGRTAEDRDFAHVLGQMAEGYDARFPEEMLAPAAESAADDDVLSRGMRAIADRVRDRNGRTGIEMVRISRLLDAADALLELGIIDAEHNARILALSDKTRQAIDDRLGG